MPLSITFACMPCNSRQGRSLIQQVFLQRLGIGRFAKPDTQVVAGKRGACFAGKGLVIQGQGQAVFAIDQAVGVAIADVLVVAVECLETVLVPVEFRCL